MNEEALLQKLSALLGPQSVRADPEHLEIYGRDETEDLYFPPLCALLPRSKEEIAALVAFARERKLPLVPRGGGTGLAGGALPVRGGLVLSLEKMQAIRDIDLDNSCCTVEPGVITQTLRETVESQGLYYPPDPSSLGSSFIGGNVATNASGPTSLKYGSTKDYLLGLEVALASGESLRIGGSFRKSSTGPNLLALFAGSEGILGIFTELTLKLIPPPQKIATLFLSFTHLRDAFQWMIRLLNQVPSVAVCEFMEREAMEIAEERLKLAFPEKGAGAFLIELHLSPEQWEGKRELEEVLSLAEKFSCGELFLAEGEKRNTLWALRRATGEAVKKVAPYKEDDSVVPRSALLPLLKEIEGIEKETGLRAVCYGHAGEGNLHVNILKERLSDEEWQIKKGAFEKRLFSACKKLGGTISGEHGIGFVQRDLLKEFLPPRQISLLSALKRELDPLGILNPEKVLPP